MEEELKRAIKLKGKKLSNNEKFLIEQFWNDENFILRLYHNGTIGYHHINDSTEEIKSNFQY